MAEHPLNGLHVAPQLMARLAAVSVLGEIVSDAAVAPSIRVRACNAVLNYARAWYEIDQIEERLDRVEIALKWPE